MYQGIISQYVSKKKNAIQYMINLLKENEEVKEDNKKISRQIEDRINQLRKAGM